MAMPHLASSASATATPFAAADRRARDDERLPIYQAALLIGTVSLGLWTGIALLVRWAFG
jgi:hypothetical protein